MPQRTVEPKPGDKMTDGTIYAGISPDTDKAMYTTPNDAPLWMTFNEAADYAAALDAHGHRNWRVPTRQEMRVLFENREQIGGFDLSGSGHAAWYWSSTVMDDMGAWCQRFADGFQEPGYGSDRISCRCVRSPVDGEAQISAREQEQLQEQSAEEIRKRLRQKALDRRPPRL